MNVEYSIWVTEILRDEGPNFLEKLSVNGMKRRRLTMQQFVLQYVQLCSGCIGTRMAKFLLSLWRDQNLCTVSYINIMYELDSTR